MKRWTRSAEVFPLYIKMISKVTAQGEGNTTPNK